MPPKSKKSKQAKERVREGNRFASCEKEIEIEIEVAEVEKKEITEEEAKAVIETFNNSFRGVPTKLIGKAVYTGDSERNIRRKNQEKKQLAADAQRTHPITSFFKPMTPVQPIQYSTPSPLMDIEEALDKLDAICNIGKSKMDNESVQPYDHARMISIRAYLEQVREGEGKMEASQYVAQTIWKKGPYLATCIRNWAKEFLETEKLAHHQQGAHAKIDALIDDEDFSQKCIEWLREQQVEKRDPLSLKKWIEEELFPKMTGSTKRETISETTCRTYMMEWGFSYSAYSKDVYYDGHEREDVIEYRKGWVNRMLDLEKRMDIFEGEEMKIVAPALGDDEKKVVQITHDECTFYANDGKRWMWIGEGESILRKKGDGKSLMVSGFVCPCCGFVDSETIEPGKNADGWWKTENMVAQVCFLFFVSFVLVELIFP